MTICQCCLSLLLASRSLSLDPDLLWLQVAHIKEMARVLSSVHAISTCPAACAGPACVQHALASPDSQFLYCAFVLFVCYSVAWGSVTFLWQTQGHLHACVLPQACPTTSCIHLVCTTVPRLKQVHTYHQIFITVAYFGGYYCYNIQILIAPVHIPLPSRWESKALPT